MRLAWRLISQSEESLGGGFASLGLRTLSLRTLKSPIHATLHSCLGALSKLGGIEDEDNICACRFISADELRSSGTWRGVSQKLATGKMLPHGQFSG